jgi:hypothetical protein
MNAVVRREPTPTEVSAPQNEAANMLAVIARAAADPACDLDKMERLMAMHERMQSRQAQAEFADALGALQSDLPSIGERGDAAGRYKFALWEDINQAIKPILQRHGFSLSFRTDTTTGVTVTGVLSHRNGHREETSITLPADASGNKNAVQAVASSVSYGKRYTAGALLNLTSHGEDDDAFLAGAGGTVNDEQAATLREWLEAAAVSAEKFCKTYKIDAVTDLPARKFEDAVQALKDKKAIRDRGTK